MTASLTLNTPAARGHLTTRQGFPTPGTISHVVPGSPLPPLENQRGWCHGWCSEARLTPLRGDQPLATLHTPEGPYS